MADEDRTVLKLKGYNGYIKFIDGEILYLKIPDIDDDASREEWFTDMEKFINNRQDSEYSLIAGLAINYKQIKYVSLI